MGVDRTAPRLPPRRVHEDEAPDAKGNLEKRTVMRFDPPIAPVKVAVLPLSPQRGPVAEGA